MAVKKPTPRLILVRHGQTEWSELGKRTSYTDLPLTTRGRELVEQTRANRVAQTRAQATSDGKRLFLQAHKVQHIICSPRTRARQTIEILTRRDSLTAGPSYPDTASQSPNERDAFSSSGHTYINALIGDREDSPDGWSDALLEVSETVREFEYGAFEGLKTSVIKQQTGNPTWETWKDDAPGGETIAQVTARVDAVIKRIRDMHRQVLVDIDNIIASDADEAAAQDRLDSLRTDVLIASHGHFLRAVGARWIGAQVDLARSLQLDAGGIAVLSYEHRSLDEPAIERWNVV
ncbi:Sedoheptulose 1,7-bisphosphatase [Savitreella phatthalungensis]